MKFMVSQRKPNTIFLRQISDENGRTVYAIDSDSGFTESSNMVLLKMGKYMEKMFTTDCDQFNDLFVLDPVTNKPAREFTDKEKKELQQEDYFRYTMAGKMMLRS
jgi:hypothetical protein